MMNLRALGSRAAIGLSVLLVPACTSDSGGGSDTTGDGGDGGSSGSTTGGGGARATLTLSGAWTYSGEFTGRVVCFWTSAGHFEFEGQAPYLVDIGMEATRDGTFDIPDYTKVMTGQITDPPGNPRIRVSRLQKVGDSSAANYPATTGTITISGTGASGTAKWTGTWAGSSTVDAELHWENCAESR
ncbi:hypothetical protein AKJ09_02782 [Labilithrix luteola]|uniref:Lipoprotein n=1 Tax=Labilithrix luteola TaxID=1391654 RepID=A0A0K1PRG2_9BACT|nr:hypothetical protein [Labilithrix luteola]AKU96118.1 hypothetical protein AKJ09_02782 [Labilithrix luteola]